MLSRLFHITHRDNVPGILERGLLCRHRIEARGIPYIDLSDPACQRRRTQRRVADTEVDLHSYVPLFVNPQNAMLFRLWRSLRQSGQDGVLVILELTGDAADWQASLLADGIASSSWTRLFRASDPSGRQAFDWRALQDSRWPPRTPEDKRRRMAEVLVSGSLSRRHIRKVWLQNPCALQSLQARMLHDARSACQVDTQGELFFHD